MLEGVFGKDAEACLKKGVAGSKGCPSVVVVAASATRCCELIRTLARFSTRKEGYCMIPKLFAKHMKIEVWGHRGHGTGIGRGGTGYPSGPLALVCVVAPSGGGAGCLLCPVVATVL